MQVAGERGVGATLQQAHRQLQAEAARLAFVSVAVKSRLGRARLHSQCRCTETPRDGDTAM